MPHLPHLRLHLFALLKGHLHLLGVSPGGWPQCCQQTQLLPQLLPQLPLLLSQQPPQLLWLLRHPSLLLPRQPQLPLLPPQLPPQLSLLLSHPPQLRQLPASQPHSQPQASPQLWSVLLLGGLRGHPLGVSQQAQLQRALQPSRAQPKPS